MQSRRCCSIPRPALPRQPGKSLFLPPCFSFISNSVCLFPACPLFLPPEICILANSTEFYPNFNLPMEFPFKTLTRYIPLIDILQESGCGTRNDTPSTFIAARCVVYRNRFIYQRHRASHRSKLVPLPLVPHQPRSPSLFSVIRLVMVSKFISCSQRTGTFKTSRLSRQGTSTLPRSSPLPTTVNESSSCAGT